MSRRRVRTWDDVEALAIELGYVVVKTKRHKKVYRANGSYVTSLPSTGSDRRGPMNAAAQLRRQHRLDQEGGR